MIRLSLAAILLAGCVEGEPNDPDYAPQYELLLHIHSPDPFFSGYVTFDTNKLVENFTITDPTGATDYDLKREYSYAYGSSSISVQATCDCTGDHLAGFVLNQTYVELPNQQPYTRFSLETTIQLARFPMPSAK